MIFAFITVLTGVAFALTAELLASHLFYIPLACAAVCAASWALFSHYWLHRVQKERERALDKRDRIVRDLIATKDFYSVEVRHDD